MEAKHNNLSRFLRQEDTRFFIPVYQRNYDWRKEQCEQLLKDIVLNHKENPNKEYFIGSIVYTSRSQTTKRDIIIIDGQQRITTINLILLTVARILEKSGDPLGKKIWNKFIQNEEGQEDNKLKLKHNQKDFIEYEYLISENYERIKNGSRIYENYKYFIEQINTPEKAIKVYEGFELLSFVEIGLNENDDAQKVFQSLNSTGLDLSQADLIRNYVLMNHHQKRQEEIFNKYWSAIEDNTFDNSSLKSKTSEFFKNYMTLKFNRIPNDKDIFNEFRNRFSLQSENDEVYNSILEELKTFSVYYSKILNPEKISEKEVQKEFLKLQKLDMTVTFPFLLALLDEYENSRISSAEVSKILRLVQSYIVRRFICNYGTNALRSVFSTLHSNTLNVMKKFSEIAFLKAVQVVLIQLSRSNTLTFPENIQVIANLETRDIYKSWLKNYFLEMIENNYSGFIEGEIDFENSNISISIEHIFPQNPSKEWLESLSKEEYQEMEARCNTLGNLTIVINNSSLGNKPFLYKRDLDKEDSKGYRHSRFNLNKNLSLLDKWNLENLNKRHKELSEKVVKIWEYPEVEDKYLIDISDDIEISIDEIGDFEFKGIKNIIINGNKLEATSYADAFKKVLMYLYKVEPEIYYHPEFRNKLKVSENKNELRRPIEISRDIYVYGNLSSNNIVQQMRAILGFTDTISDIRLKIKS